MNPNFKLGIKQKKNFAMLILAIFTAAGFPMLRTMMAPILDIAVPIPFVENVGGLVAVAGLLVLYWMYSKDI